MTDDEKRADTRRMALAWLAISDSLLATDPHCSMQALKTDALRAVSMFIALHEGRVQTASMLRTLADVIERAEAADQAKQGGALQ